MPHRPFHTFHTFFFAALLSALLLVGCYPYTEMAVHANASRPPYPDSTLFIVLPQRSHMHIQGIRIGSVTYHTGFMSTVKTDWWSPERRMIALRDTALHRGANLARITKTDSRSRQWFGADLYRVDDAEAYNYEDEVDWPSRRLLRFGDFKSAPDPNAVQIGQVQGAYEVGTFAKFLRQDSWIDRGSKDSVKLLAHEQGAFDLCEVYCLQFRTWIMNGNAGEPYLSRVNKAWMAKRSEYEWQTFHGLDSARQAAWIAKIDHALKAGGGAPDPEFQVE